MRLGLFAAILLFFSLEASSFVHQNFAKEEMIFIKLGGSLITDKTVPYTENPQNIEKLANEIAALIKARPHVKIILGHGSGSFGHRAAIEHHYDREKGFVVTKHGACVAQSAFELHAIVISALLKAGVPAFSIPPSATARLDRKTQNIVEMDLRQITRILEIGGIPVIYGDVVPFMDGKGTGIVSTEKLFSYLAFHCKPSKIFLLGEVEGVYHPHQEHLLDRITPRSWKQIVSTIEGESGYAVTGGMRQKVDQMIQIVQKIPYLQVYIASGVPEGILEKLYRAENIGTQICAKY